MWLRKLLSAFPCAGRGILVSLRRERNLRVHLTAVCYVCWAGALAGLEGDQWAILCLCFGLVIGMELMNTALEELCDRVTRQPDPFIRRAKDAAAGAVLACALASAAVAAWIFGPWLLSGGLWRLMRESPAFDGALALSIPAAVAWIAWQPKQA